VHVEIEAYVSRAADLTVNSFWWTPTRNQLGPHYTIRGIDEKGEIAFSPNFLVGIAPTSSSSVANPVTHQVIDHFPAILFRN